MREDPDTLDRRQRWAGAEEDWPETRDVEGLLKFDRFRALRALICALTMGTFALPWVWQDGAASSTSGAQLLVYTFNGPERSEWVRHSFIGAVSLTVLPWVGLALVAAATIRCLIGERAMLLHTLAAATPLTIMLCAGGITSTGHNWGSLVQPGGGMALLILAQGGLAAVSWKYWWDDRQAQRERDEYEEESGERDREESSASGTDDERGNAEDKEKE